MTDYKVVRVKDYATIDYRAHAFIREVAAEMSAKYGTFKDWENFPIDSFAWNNYLALCYRGDEPVGLMGASIYRSIFDKKTLILRQNLLYASPGTRAAYYLMHDFVDFGRANAEHLITMIAAHTNISARSLKRLGFSELETLFRMEVKRG